jgi:hypothetical protein
MFKQATVEDLDIVLGFAKEFHKKTPYNVVEFDEVYVTKIILGCIEGGGCFLNDSGFIAGILTPFMLNPQYLVGTELAWYCPKGNGRELKDAFEDWALEAGASIVQFSTFNNSYAENLMHYLEEDGYKPVEISYIKGFD